MKINKLIFSFFIVVGFLIQAYGVEDSRDRDSKSQRVNDIKAQISFLQKELYDIEQPQNLQQYSDNNNLHMCISASQTVDIDDDTIAVSRLQLVRDNLTVLYPVVAGSGCGFLLSTYSLAFNHDMPYLTLGGLGVGLLVGGVSKCCLSDTEMCVKNTCAQITANLTAGLCSLIPWVVAGVNILTRDEPEHENFSWWGFS
jgi:hypothetical protein